LGKRKSSRKTPGEKKDLHCIGFKKGGSAKALVKKGEKRFSSLWKGISSYNRGIKLPQLSHEEVDYTTLGGMRGKR